MSKKKNTKKTPLPTSAKNTKKPLLADTIWYQILPVIYVVFSILLLFFYIFTDNSGVLGKPVKDLLFGLFSYGAWLIPICLIKQVITWKKDVEKNNLLSNFIYSFLTIICVSVLTHSIVGLWGSGIAKDMNLGNLYNSGVNLNGGGMIGGLLSSALSNFLGTVPTFIISLTVVIVFIIFLVGLTPIKIAELIINFIKEKREERALLAEQEELASEQEEEENQKEIDNKNQKIKTKRDKIMKEIEQTDTDSETDTIPIITDTKETDKETFNEKELDLEEIFVNKENLELSKKMLTENADVETQKIDISIPVGDTEADNPIQSINKSDLADDENEQEKEYQYPPISFLTKDASTKQDIREELNATAAKLVSTLESFGVKTTVVDISRGPSVTRYELQPQVGVKVKSIGNLVDDIALHLAAKGSVRIEAPIPGKSAVGIEIPNKNSSMVRLRGLIESEKFSESESKLTTALGQDVAGNPVYMNVAAMPHLLIAGATGMGKSVCINSLIISILYKAKPDEVKLILIDPKKVELNMYNGIPHLIVPVVSDPKKSAGALRWAVNEMERRFQLMDSCGARNLAGYNEIANIDSDHEKLPEIVIIIDELADLMMTAPKEVEDSICRIAQKARAAGMHLIIGTQRPSVDVITGLIKANIPSRIAFTVASQIDSRTIIDIAGAEKLCGKGDMLYAPVGISKPMRVQGGFVSTEEVERVCDFIKTQFIATYDDEVAKSIDAEADKCGVKGLSKDKLDGTDNTSVEGMDEMLISAIEMAIDAGENGISTSMLQRRLSLGYARAGRLIDTMENMGIIGGHEGSKPRKVIMTREQYMEMKMNGFSSTKSTENEDV